MRSVLRNEKIAACDLENGLELYVDGERLGYTLGEVQLQGNATWVDLYQGQPSKLVGSRLARLEGTLTVPCLEMTPETHTLASGIGSLVMTSTDSTETSTDIIKLNGTTPVGLFHDDVTASSIVVKDETGTTTYTEDTDYAITTDEAGHTFIARIAEGAIASGAMVQVSYSYTAHDNTPYLFFGAAKAPITMQNVVLAKYNPGAQDKPWHIIQIWLVESKSSYSMTWNQDSQTWMALNLELGLLSDEQNTAEYHDLCPLWMESWADSFDINNLPAVPDNATPIM